MENVIFRSARESSRKSSVHPRHTAIAAYAKQSIILKDFQKVCLFLYKEKMLALAAPQLSQGWRMTHPLRPIMVY